MQHRKTKFREKKIEYVDEKIPDINGLVITAVLNSKIGVVKNKIPDVSDLVKKTDYDAKISDIERNISQLLIVINLQLKYLMHR